ncbi:MAG: hypothetical protein K5637_01890 [Lachnospiraceae bacterium]|nr:hypothetical protein [Lachnospiraceae bacterium]
MTIDEAIETLVQAYLAAQGQDWIGDPVAWALNKVWKEAEEQRRENDAKR